MSEMPDDDLNRLRALRPADAEAVQWEQPPAALWNRIAEEAGVSQRPVVLAEPLRRRFVPFSLAAAAVIVLMVAAVVVFSGGSDGDTVVAAAQLDRLAGNGSGSAELVNHKGHMQLHLHTTDLDPDGGYIEVWMIDPTVTKMVSLGPLRADGSYDLPDTMDPSEFPIVDISAEPNDGNPAHSGTSLLRGELTSSI